MSNKKRHPTAVKGFGSNMRRLGHEVARLRYDKIVEFLKGFEEDTRRQAKGDFTKGRVVLSSQLMVAVIAAQSLRIIFTQIFKVCAPYMKDELT